MTADSVKIAPVDTAADMDAFIRLPYRLHADDKTWIPPLLMERRDALSANTNPYVKRANVRFWLARRNGQVVGRISAQMDPLVAKTRSPEEGHFGLIAVEDDPDIFAALTRTAEDWLRAQGAKIAYGPFNLSINEETGLLIKGSDTAPMMMMGHDYGYVSERLEEQGYTKARDVFAYLVDARKPLSRMLAALKDRALPDNTLVRPIRMKSYHDDVRLIVDIFNDAWSDNWGFVPFEADEVEHMAKQLKPLINPKLVWFVEIDNKPAAFIVCLPNVNEAISDLNGKLLPFGWAKLLWRLKVRGLKSVRVPLMGVRKEYLTSLQGPMIVGSLMNRVINEVIRLGVDKVEMSWVLEDNTPMRRLAEKMGGEEYKTYRIFQKSLT
ncbi:MAG: N-acetyltransferase [Roseobacter sp.]